MRPKNVWKHLSVGIVVGFIAGIIVLIFGLQQIQWLMAVGFTFATIAWELEQKRRATLNVVTLIMSNWNWLDALADFLAGNLAFYVIYICII